jgi:hypothetical protein
MDFNYSLEEIEELIITGDYHAALQIVGRPGFQPGDGSLSEFIMIHMHTDHYNKENEFPIEPKEYKDLSVFLRKVSRNKLSKEEHHRCWLCYSHLCKHYGTQCSPVVYHSRFFDSTPVELALSLAQRGDIGGLEILFSYFCNLLNMTCIIDQIPATVPAFKYAQFVLADSNLDIKWLSQHIINRHNCSGNVLDWIEILENNVTYVDLLEKCKRLQDEESNFQTDFGLKINPMHGKPSSIPDTTNDTPETKGAIINGKEPPVKIALVTPDKFSRMEIVPQLKLRGQHFSLSSHFIDDSPQLQQNSSSDTSQQSENDVLFHVSQSMNENLFDELSAHLISQVLYEELVYDDGHSPQVSHISWPEDLITKDMTVEIKPSNLEAFDMQSVESTNVYDKGSISPDPEQHGYLDTEEDRKCSQIASSQNIIETNCSIGESGARVEDFVAHGMSDEVCNIESSTEQSSFLADECEGDKDVNESVEVHRMVNDSSTEIQIVTVEDEISICESVDVTDERVNAHEYSVSLERQGGNLDMKSDVVNCLSDVQNLVSSLNLKETIDKEQLYSSLKIIQRRLKRMIKSLKSTAVEENEKSHDIQIPISSQCMSDPNELELYKQKVIDLEKVINQCQCHGYQSANHEPDPKVEESINQSREVQSLEEKLQHLSHEYEMEKKADTARIHYLQQLISERDSLLSIPTQLCNEGFHPKTSSKNIQSPKIPEVSSEKAELRDLIYALECSECQRAQALEDLHLEREFYAAKFRSLQEAFRRMVEDSSIRRPGDLSLELKQFI